jgi:Sensors of blue-light using FAD
MLSQPVRVVIVILSKFQANFPISQWRLPFKVLKELIVPPMPLIHLVYVSSATVPFTQAALLALLEISRRKNESVGLSGMLLFRDGNFMQVLEGEEAVVNNAYARISKDPRHEGLITMLNGPITERNFADWSMGFRNLDSIEARLAGYSEFMNEDWRGQPMQESPLRALKLLQIFRQGIR